MGGIGSGGRRPRAGRPQKVGSVRWQRAERRAQRAGAPPAVQAPSALVAAPEGLEPDALAVWSRLAPFALESRSLTPATAEAFALGCRVVALERAVSATNAAGSNHRGLLVRVEAFLLRFGLMPTGKPIAQTEQPADEWAEFDRPLALVRGGK